MVLFYISKGPPWTFSYGSLIYIKSVPITTKAVNFISDWRGVLDTALCDKIYGYQGCGIAMPDSYIEPAGQVDFPG